MASEILVSSLVHEEENKGEKDCFGNMEIILHPILIMDKMRLKYSL